VWILARCQSNFQPQSNSNGVRVKFYPKTKRNGEEFWGNHVEIYYKSGLSQKEYCRQENISYWSFNSWKRKLEKSKPKNKIIEIPRDKFRSLTSASESFEIIISNNLKISIPNNFDAEVFKRIIQTVESEKC